MGKKNLKAVPWTSKGVNFQDDLKSGKKGQEKVVRAGKNILRELDGKRNDLELVRTKETIELKTETYKLNERRKFSREKRSTPNIFIERWSDEQRAHIGGPFQAMQKGSKFYMHVFANGKVVIFKTEELVKFLNKIDFTQKYAKKKASIFNKVGKKSWVTVGYSIPFKDLEKLAVVTTLKGGELQKAFRNLKRRQSRG